MDGLDGASDLEGVEIDRAIAEDECGLLLGLFGSRRGCLSAGRFRIRRFRIRGPMDAAKKPGQTREQDVEIEGFGKVVVGAGGESFNDVLQRPRAVSRRTGVKRPASRNARTIEKPSWPGSMTSSSTAAGGSGVLSSHARAALPSASW